MHRASSDLCALKPSLGYKAPALQGLSTLLCIPEKSLCRSKIEDQNIILKDTKAIAKVDLSLPLLFD